MVDGGGGRRECLRGMVGERISRESVCGGERENETHTETSRPGETNRERQRVRDRGREIEN